MRRKFGNRFRLLGSVTAILFALAVPSQASAWTLQETDNWGFWDYTGARVWTQGTVKWYRDFPSGKAYLQPAWAYQAKSGCTWVKVSFNYATGSVSWPPAGTPSSTSDGWLRRCMAAGRWLSFAGQTYASATLTSTTVCIAFSPSYAPNQRVYQACKKMYRGFG